MTLTIYIIAPSAQLCSATTADLIEVILFFLKLITFSTSAVKEFECTSNILLFNVNNLNHVLILVLFVQYMGAWNNHLFLRLKVFTSFKLFLFNPDSEC